MLPTFVSKIKIVPLIAIISFLVPSICSAKKAKITPYDLLEHIQRFSKSSADNKVDKKKETPAKREEPKKVVQNQKEKPTVNKVSVSKKDIPNLDVTIHQNINKTLITFPWKEPVGVAVYESSNYLWVIFDKKGSIKINILNDFVDDVTITHPIVGDYIVPDIGEQASCIMLKLSRRNDHGNNFLLSKSGNIIDLSITNDYAKTTNIGITSKPLNIINQRIEFNIENLKNTGIVSFADPIIGDKVDVLTINDMQYNIENDHLFIDFDVIKSMQGIVIREKSDNLQINKDDLALWITSKTGLNISSKNTSLKGISFFQKSRFDRLSQFVNEFGIVTLKPYVKTLPQFQQIEEALRKQLYNSPQSEEYNIRMNLALLYLANDYLPEATAHLEYAYSLDISLKENYDFLLLYAVAKFMEDKFKDAQEIIDLIDISLVPVKYTEEIEFWKNIIYISNGRPVYLKTTFIDKFFAANGDFLSEYPANILSKIKFLVIKYLLQNKKYESAKETIALLSTFDLSPKYKARLYYTKANLYEQTADDQNAIVKYLSKCINTDNSLYYSALCQLKLIDIQLKTKSINLNEAIKELQQLDLYIRNSKLEVVVLEKLASLFYKNKEYANALLIWRTITTYYPHSDHVLSIIYDMGTTFVDIFLKDLGNYTSFQKVAIFDEFASLNPIGDIGDEVALKLSDNLIDLDLLERASTILEHQVKYRLHGFIKEATLNKLLGLYLKLNQANKILKIFEANKLDGLPAQISDSRKYIYAKAFTMEKQYDNAIKILGNDLSEQADNIRSNIYWKTQNWKAFNDNSEPYIYLLMQHDLPLTAKDAKKILMQSISYSFLNRVDLLAGLISNFKDRLQKNHKEVLDMINLLIKLQNQEKSNLKLINTEHIQLCK